MIVEVPAGNVLVLKVTAPAEAPTVAIGVEPEKNVTVPVGTAAPAVGVIWAVKVIDWPADDGF